MVKRLIILTFFLLPTILFGQKKYKYTYRQHLTSQQSTFTTNSKDIGVTTNKSILTFHILDKKEVGIPFANIKIKNSVTDTTIQSDSDGFASAKLPQGTFSISISEMQFIAINIDNFILKENTNTTISSFLGKSNALRIAIIHSLRKLKVKEIKQIIDDLSNDKVDSELIKNKTCYLMWEI